MLLKIPAARELIQPAGIALASLELNQGGCVTAKEFLDVSTKLFNDLKVWITEASKDNALSPSDLAMLNAAMKIVERVTLREVEAKPQRAN